jgi:type VI secretion system secreted protein Hcp
MKAIKKSRLVLSGIVVVLFTGTLCLQAAIANQPHLSSPPTGDAGIGLPNPENSVAVAAANPMAATTGLDEVGPGLAIYMKIAEYPGSYWYGSEEGLCLVYAVQWSINQPYNLVTGQVTSLHRHTALTVIKNLDKASPGLAKALTTGQNLHEVTISFYRIQETGGEELYYTITLENARVVNFEQTMNYNDHFDDILHLDKISFIYQTIEWNWLPDNVAEMDQWYP